MIVRCKQPTKIETPLQYSLLVSYSVGEIIVQTVFSMSSKVIILMIQFIFWGINIFWALLRAHFNPHQTARAKMSLSRAQIIFIPANINSIVLLERYEFKDPVLRLPLDIRKF